MIRRNRFLVVIAAGALMLFSYLIGNITFEPFEQQWLREIKSGPEYVMQDTRTIQYNELGLERFSMTTTQLSQSLGSRTIEITNPRIVLEKTAPKTAHQTWIISADHGQILNTADQSHEQLLLDQNVIIRSLQPDTDGFSLNTSKLEISPESKLASSSEPVVIIARDVSTSATGLDLDFDRGIVKLRSQVNTTIQPHSLNQPAAQTRSGH
jgi:LPS export ABC transporter protein LptC